MLRLVRRHPRAAALAAYFALAAAATWPLLARFGSEVGGGHARAWQSLWELWWWKESLARGASPFFADALRWPAGAATALEARNVPTALALLPMWLLTPTVPEVALYNAALFVSFPLAGLTAYLLCRELWGGELAPFLAGALYATSAYQFGHALGNLDIASSYWAPLYFLGLVRTLRRHGPGPPLLAGAALAGAALTSPHHLAFCLVGTVVLMGAALRADRTAVLCAPTLRRGELAVAVFALLAGWSYAALVRARVAPDGAAGALATAPGGSAAESADLLSFFVPGVTSAWRGAGWRVLAGGGAEPAGYVGYVVLGLAALAALRAKAARRWLVVAVAGLVLALGPRLVVAGRSPGGFALPFGWLERVAPALTAGAVPARFGWLVTFGAVVAAGAGLSYLVRAGRRGTAWAVALTALALVERWPGPMPASAWPAPRFLRDLARDGERWAVLDVTAQPRRLWNQVLHRHPQLGGAAAPRDGAERWGGATPALRAFLGRGGLVVSISLAPSATREEAIRSLQELDVRFVITDRATAGAVRALRLPRVHDADGLTVYEVPARTG
jgi:hypothetical protein